MGLEKTAAIVVEKCMGIKGHEKVLIVTDSFAEKIGQALYSQSAKITETIMVKMPETRLDGQEPAKEIADLMKKFDVVLCPTRHSLTHTKARKAATAKGARIATLPGITEEMFLRAVDIDYDEIRKRCEKVSDALSKSSKVRILTRSGTDFHLEITGSKVIEDNGSYTRPKDYGNLPAGEVFLAPKDSAGIFVIDRLKDLCGPKTKVSVRNNTAQEIFDKNLRELVWKYKNARNIAEFGIGVNPKAVLSGSTLEDEKVLGTCHIAFGSNFDFGGRVKSEVHWDAILLKPTVYFDDRKIMDEGDLLL
jgi:leucyl aminopeptidase (aminopeptidase T)